MIKIIWLFLLLFFATSVQSKMAFLPAPLSVTASSNLVGSIKITWKKNSQGGAVDYYTIYRSTTPNVTGAEERLGTVKQGLPLSFTDSNPIPAKKYYYWVVSCPQENAQSTADMGISCSNILVQKSVVGQTKYTKMAAPGNFKITNNNADGFVYLQWDVVSNAFSYKVMRDGKNYTTVTTNSFIDKNVVDKKSYLYNVKACDQFENCGASVQKSIKVIGAVVVPKIMSISANPQSIVQGQSLTLSTTLNAVLPSGYSVKVNYGNSLISMSGSGMSYSVSQTPTSTGMQTFIVGIYDNKSELKSNSITGNFEVTKPELVIKTSNYTKIANNGSSLPDSAVLGTKPTDWACTKDNKTGLIWEVKTSDGGLRDKGWFYSWYEPDANKNAGFSGYQNGNDGSKNHPEYCKGSDCDTYAYKNAVNKKGLCGANDWRMPNGSELFSLVYCPDGNRNKLGVENDFNNSGPVCSDSRVNDELDLLINTTFFPDVPSSGQYLYQYWSSRTFTFPNDEFKMAWGLDFQQSFWGAMQESNQGYVRLVHSTIEDNNLVNTLSGILPVNGMSGTEITLIGTGFSDKSQVMVGGQLAATRYVSDTELHFAIPFTSINGQLNSLPADKYNVQVNGSNSLVLQVDELPANPYPAGTVLSEQVNTMYQQLSETSAQYQKMLPDLLVEAKDDKSLQNILKLVGDIANKLNAEGLSDLNQKIGKIDQQALDLLERSIVANESKNNTPSPNKIQKLQMNAVYGVVASSEKEGDTWLLKRKGNADISNALEKIDKYTAYGCAAVTVGTSVFATPATGVMAAQLCSALASSNLIVGITTDILNTKTVGRISRLNLKISGITDKDKVFQVTSKNEHIDLNVEKNNKAKNIVSASIGVTNNLPHATLAKKTFDMGTGFKSTLTAKSAVGAMVDKLKDELRSYVTAKDVANGEKIDPAKEIDKFISPNDKKFDISLSNLEFFPCNLDNKIIVLDDGTISVTSTSEQKIEVGLCKFQVKEKSRLPLEEDVDSVISFTIVGGGYTKIANNGSSLPDSAVLGTNPTDWACTKDNKTGLIWEVKTSDGGLRDENNMYTNYDAIYPKCDRTNCESQLGASTNTDGFVKAVNAQGLCGSSNWRLPTKDELLTILPARYGTGYFEDYSRTYWSSSPYAYYSISRASNSLAWVVLFNIGASSAYDKRDGGFVRLVR